MIISTTGNGFFMTAIPFASSFVFMLIEEFPTFLLALGSVYPSLRTGLIIISIIISIIINYNLLPN